MGDESEEAGGSAEPGMLRLRAERLEARLRRAWSPVHLAARVAQVQQIEDQVGEAAGRILARQRALQARLAARLWMPPPLQTVLLGRLAHSLAQLQDWRRRLAETRRGFAGLPCDPGLPPAAPEPVPLGPA